MPITHEYDYVRPKKLSEACRALSRRQAVPLAGGTDLLVWLKEGLSKPQAVVDLKGLKELKKLEFRNKTLRIGALVTFSELIDSQIVRQQFPVLWESARTVASVGVRNRATLAGNICSAVPSADAAPALLVYEATVHAQGARGRRKISIGRWFVGPKKTALKPGEVVTEITLPMPSSKNAGCYVKLGRYSGEDLAQVGVALLGLAGQKVRVAFCAVGPVPKRARRIEDALNGRSWDDRVVQGAVGLVPREISPIDDIRSSKAYRLHMAGVMLERGIKTVSARLSGNDSGHEKNLLS